jgi:hypothetical protein
MRSAVLTSIALLSAMVGVTLEGQIRGGSIAGRVTEATESDRPTSRALLRRRRQLRFPLLAGQQRELLETLTR